ncbi:MAG: tRNA (adenosine(37)-N6)-dimethylallyltransferase MiaA [Terriglobia bacterium]
MSQDHPLVAIVGPTAAGKSELAIELAEHLEGEVLNYDSVQVYRGFDIGTGKVPLRERRDIAHHLLDVVEPGEVFTAGDFRIRALEVLAGIRARGKLPVVVGGTGLYLRALLLGLFEGPTRSEELRGRLGALAKRRGREFLHRLLARLDEKAGERIHARDTPKVIRALEVRLLAREPMSQMLERGRTGLTGFRVLKVGLRPDRKQLAHRINARVERMFAEGLLDETRRMLERPDAAGIKPLGALGYRQACAVLRGEISREEGVRETQTATRRYAKRQMTWFRREPGVEWFEGFGDDPAVCLRALAWVRQALTTSTDAPRAPGGEIPIGS